MIAALDDRLFEVFQLLTGPCSGLVTYLHSPTEYERYLRRVVISWFVRQVGMSATCIWQWLSHAPFEFPDHPYSAAAAGRKRKATSKGHSSQEKHAKGAAKQDRGEKGGTVHRAKGAAKQDRGEKGDAQWGTHSKRTLAE